jgi:hypothetical protein
MKSGIARLITARKGDKLRDLRQFAQSMTHARGAQEDRGGHGMNI